MPNKLSKFWQELKRRKVVRVITVYAAAAFVILELVDIIADPLKLPEWFLSATIVFLCIGFIITVIVSWIYDIHPEGGIVKTEPAHMVLEEETPKSSNSWKIASYISFGVILVMVGIMLYPKIFKPDKLKDLRDESGVITVAVLPFDNLTGDSSLYVWENGIMEYLINGIARSEELLVSSSQVIRDVLEGTRQVSQASLAPELARKTASKIDASTYITGNFMGTGKNMSIMLNLVDTDKGDVIWSTRVDGDLGNDYRSVLDRLADTVRNHMEIKALEDKVETDLTHAFPNSAEAYKYYIHGLNAIIASNYESAIESLEMAYEIDTTFTFAAFYLALAHNFGGSDLFEGYYHWTRRAHELKNNLPPEYSLWIDLWYAGAITKDLEKQLRYCDILYEAAIHSRFLLLDLGVTYNSYYYDFDKAISAFKKVEELNKQWEDDWRYDKYYEEYTWALLMADRPEEVEHIADIGLQINPKNHILVRRKGAAAIMMNDSAAAQRYREEFMSLALENGHPEVITEFLLGNMYRWGKDYRRAADHYRRAYELDKEEPDILGWLIYSQLRGDINIEECLKISELELEQNPESIAFRWGKGVSLHKLGKDQEALAILLPLKERMPYNKELQRVVQEVEQSLANQK